MRLDGCSLYTEFISAIFAALRRASAFVGQSYQWQSISKCELRDQWHQQYRNLLTTISEKNPLPSVLFWHTLIKHCHTVMTGCNSWEQFLTELDWTLMCELMHDKFLVTCASNIQCQELNVTAFTLGRPAANKTLVIFSHFLYPNSTQLVLYNCCSNYHFTTNFTK